MRKENSQQMRLFEEQEALEKVNALDSKLRRIKENVNFEMFRPILEKAFGKKVDAPVGRPSFDAVMMFKILWVPLKIMLLAGERFLACPAGFPQLDVSQEDTPRFGTPPGSGQLLGPSRKSSFLDVPLLLQRLDGLSDAMLGFFLHDRRSYLEFLDLASTADLPDIKTIWHYRNQLSTSGLLEEVFYLFLSTLDILVVLQFV